MPCSSRCRALALAIVILQATPTPLPAQATATPDTPPDSLHALAEALWEEHAPDELKAEYVLPGPEELTAFFNRLEQVGQQQDLAAFAALAPEARTAFDALRAFPELTGYTAWLREILADLEAAGEALQPVPPPLPPPSRVRPPPTWSSP